MKQKRHYAAITFAVYVISSLPHLFGYLRQTSDERFSGVVYNVVDTAQYFAWMRAFSSNVLIANPITPDETAERFFNLQWWLLGIAGRGSPDGILIMYQVLRIAALGGFAIALAYFCHLTFRRHSLLAFTIVMLSSGLGWLLVVLKQLTGELAFPLAVQTSEANTYFSAMAFPHLLVAGGLELAIFGLFLLAGRRSPWMFSAIIFGLTLMLGFSHGYDLIPTAIIPLATVGILLIRDRKLPAHAIPAGAIVAGSVGPALYSLLLTRMDESWSIVLSQYGNAEVYSPSPPLLILLMGVPFLLALWQIRPDVWKDIEPGRLMVRIWLVVGFFLLYIPTDYQIKMLTAYQVPVGILAAETLMQLSTTRRIIVGFPINLRRLAPALFIGVIILTNVYLTVWRMVELNRANYPYFISNGDVAALKAVAEVEGSDVVVLSSETLGSFVPIYSDARPFVAHWAMTLHYFERREQSRWFFASTTTATEREDFLRTHDIDYVIAGPAEASLVEGARLPALDLDPIFVSSTVVFSVRTTAGVDQ